MDAKSGYVVSDVPCPSCKQLHDLFIEIEEPSDTHVRYTCPHTGNAATWLCDRAAHLTQEKPDGTIHAVRHVD